MRWPVGFGLMIMMGCAVLQSNSQLSTLNSQLLYGSNRDGNWEIYTMDVVSKKERRLTNSKADDLWPVGSPDGKRIVFVSNRDGNQEIYVMEEDGSRQIRLTNTLANEEDPTWSPDSQQIAFVSERDGNREIYVLSLVSNNSQLSTLNSQLFRLTIHPTVDELPVWSPDGESIAFVSERDGNPEIYLLSQLTSFNSQLSTLNSQLTRLTDHPASDGLDGVSWSPDGSRIAFVSERDGNPEIYILSQLSTFNFQLTRLTSHPAADDAPVWSPNGQSIAFISDRDRDVEIYVLSLPSTLNSQLSTLNFQLSRLTHAPGSDLWPVWSPIISGGPCGSENRPPMPPDPAQPLAKPEGCFGSQIAFISERDGNPEVYVMQADGTGQRRMTRTAAEEKWVSWLK